MHRSQSSNSAHRSATSGTFSTKISSGRCTSAYWMTDQKVARVRSIASCVGGSASTGLPVPGLDACDRLHPVLVPPAGDASVQIGEAHSACARGSFRRLMVVTSTHSCHTSGKLAWWVATSQWLAANRRSQPALASPAEDPPAPHRKTTNVRPLRGPRGFQPLGATGFGSRSATVARVRRGRAAVATTAAPGWGRIRTGPPGSARNVGGSTARAPGRRGWRGGARSRRPC
jgi:hypothetical protein